MKNVGTKEIITLIIALIPVLAVGLIWSSLPEQVPLHYDIHGKVDSMGSKTSLLIPIMLLSVGVYALLYFLPQLDPRQKNNEAMPTFRLVLHSGLSSIALCVLYQTMYPEVQFIERVLPLILFALFAVMGYFMIDIKPNYFVGIRTPWTLDNEVVWQQTHRVGGKLWLYGGIIGFILCLILPSVMNFIILIAFVLSSAFFSMLYSYFLYQQQVNTKNK